MKVLRRRFIRAFLRKLWKLSNGVLSSMPYEYLQYWAQDEEAAAVPKDVPRGHMVVYVGGDRRRFVIGLDFLQHPLFRALLDQAQEEYGFSHGRWGLCLPCDESSFVGHLRQIGAALQQGRRVRRCLALRTRKPQPTAAVSSYDHPMN
ncbi:hypothetical protein Taro_009401 [Colocasia esculenta]|uniref:Uncharacterized protein n=1 Tax=Colocasia esculenta TaxID=4460 RepID=A0A843U6B9_COLES|nr:hypothetical protein [Colocasia esculenta]